MPLLLWKQTILIILMTCPFLATCAVDPGFDLLIGTTVNESVHDHPIFFDKPLPTWLKGSLIRNGPAQYEMGKRKFLNLFDAYGKLNKWTFPGNGSAFFSAKFIGTQFYNTSVEEDDIALYQIFDATIPPMSLEERLIALAHGMDNMNINIYNYTDHCVILSDIWKVYTVDCRTLATIELVTPPTEHLDLGIGYVNQMSTAHPVPEVGTDNFFTYLTSMSIIPGQHHKIVLLRITSSNNREKVAEFKVEHAPYMHSFSVTKNYIIILSHPYYVDIAAMLETGSPKQSIKWYPDMPAVIYVVEIKTGKVQSFETKTVFSMHHINAYETSDFKLIMDVASYSDSDLVLWFESTTILNKEKRDSVHWQAVLKRFVIDLVQNDVQVVTFPASPDVPYASGLEVPTINEKYRSQSYCFVYGLVFQHDNGSFANFAFVKKDVCNSTGDKSWKIYGHYPMEGWFVADPNGKDEDDGIIMLPVVDGIKRQSYLAILDAKTLVTITKSYMPIIVPFHFHGRFFPNVY